MSESKFCWNLVKPHLRIIIVHSLDHLILLILSIYSWYDVPVMFGFSLSAV